MNTGFTLKNVVDFLEANGCYVREAEEIEKVEAVYPLAADREQPERKAEAIRVVIAPKADGHPRPGEVMGRL